MDVKKRGRWKSDKSAARHERHARLASGYWTHPVEAQRYAVERERRAEAIILHGLAAPLPLAGGRK